MTRRPLRTILRSDFGREIAEEPSDQAKGLPRPAVEKEVAESETLIPLPTIDARTNLQTRDFFTLVEQRRSHRRFTDQELTLEELSFLLWATAGVRQIVDDGYCTLRTVPSAGARHPFDTYLAVRRIQGLEPDVVYRYVAQKHGLVAQRRVPDLAGRAAESALGQTFVAHAAVTFFWVCVPYRSEWRYAARSYKADLLDAGHICQNLYLAAEAIGCGTCAIAAYSQQACDDLLGIDGEQELTVYLAPVGKRA